MCITCGCGSDQVHLEGVPAPDASAHAHRHPHPHAPADPQEHVHADGTRHSHFHGGAHTHAAGAPEVLPAHVHAPGIAAARAVQIEQDLLASNNAYAQANRQALARRGILALNLVSSPGAGKTSLLCQTIARLGQQPVAVIEGDQQTSQDAQRIRAAGAQAIQINTGKGCHLDAHMVGHALDQLRLQDDSLLLIENVGNLVCPAAFDLGEAHKVVILSVTEGEDKPIKYPDMFRAASLMLLNKIDLLPYLQYDRQAAIAYARQVNPTLRIIELSATSGAGMDEWLAYLAQGLAQARLAREQLGHAASNAHASGQPAR